MKCLLPLKDAVGFSPATEIKTCRHRRTQRENKCEECAEQTWQLADTLELIKNTASSSGYLMSYREDQAAASISTSPSPVDEDQDSSVADDDDDMYDDDEDEEDDDEETYDDEDHTRQRRDVELHPPVVARRPMMLGRTDDGVPVLSHSYAAIKELNRTGALSSLRLYDTLARTDDNNGEATTTTEDPIKLHHRISEKTSYHKRRSPQHVTSAPWPVIQRRSRVMQTPEEGEAVSTTFDKDAVLPPRGEIVMRVLQPESSENNNQPLARESHPGAFARAPTLRSHDPLNPNGDAVAVKPRRNHRRKFNRNGTRNHARVTEFDEAPPHAGPRRLAAHFAANATMYALGHPNFAGNGRLRHPGVFSDWSPSPWMRDLGMDSHFVLSDGVLTVRQPGLYFFYSQIYYVDDHDNNGYNVYVNGAVRLQCTTMTHSSSAVTKINTCYTGSVIFLRDGDTVYLRDISGLRYSMFEPEKSFFGLFRLAEARIR
ncbi:hypothetical protein B566_EDAN004564 [Ephemera danica]|nr:hypothetical protein B566_EDAN004564 [Ephemera danica]